MNAINCIIIFFKRKQDKKTPLIIQKMNTLENIPIDFTKIENAIADIEHEPNISTEKLRKLKISLHELKNSSSIKIRKGKLKS